MMKIKGIDKVVKFLDKASKLLDTSEFYAKASIVMLQNVRNNFKKEKNSDGSSWTPLKYRKGKMLRDSGNLFNSTINAYDKKNAVVGTDKVYAGVHNYGYKKRNIPQREFMFLSEQGGLNLEKMTTDSLGKL